MNQLKQPIDDLSEAMVKNIANELIKVDSAAEGRGAQRHWYLQAKKMLKKLMKEYKEMCEEMYNE